MNYNVVKHIQYLVCKIKIKIINIIIVPVVVLTTTSKIAAGNEDTLDSKSCRALIASKIDCSLQQGSSYISLHY